VQRAMIEDAPVARICRRPAASYSSASRPYSDRGARGAAATTRGPRQSMWTKTRMHHVDVGSACQPVDDNVVIDARRQRHRSRSCNRDLMMRHQLRELDPHFEGFTACHGFLRSASSRTRTDSSIAAISLSDGVAFG
jgi:hypothetical protein